MTADSTHYHQTNSKTDYPDYDQLPQPVVAMESRWHHGASTGWHSHPRGQLLYATEGVMVIHTEAGSWVIPPNRALWMVTSLQHNVTMSGDVVMRTAYINVQQVPAMPAHSCAINVSPLLRELLVEAVRITPGAAPSPRNARVLDLLIDEIQISPTLPLHLPLPQDARLQRICTALMEYPADAASAAQWAQSIQVAERTLHRLFAQDTGMTFAQWREQARLLHALRRIASGDKVIDIALDCGYASPSAFSAMFRRHFGVTPSGFYR
ncbi:MAG: helix-turn-helix transcriptional regulator [Comamonas sp.]